MIRYNSQLHIYYSTKIDDSLFFSGFGTKQSAPLVQITKDYQIITPNQIRGDTIVVIDDEAKNIEADGLITRSNHIVLTVQTADCVPIIFADRKKKLIGISHQGWKGSLLRLPQKMIQQFLHLKSDVRDLAVAIGPSIGACCYDVNEERFSLFKNEFSSYQSFWQTEGESRISKIFFNLSYLNYLQLIESGLTKEQIDFFPFCTRCNDEKFYSYRRNDMASEMTNFICIK